jgi:hypothetical protein
MAIQTSINLNRNFPAEKTSPTGSPGMDRRGSPVFQVDSLIYRRTSKDQDDAIRVLKMHKEWISGAR